MRMCKAGFQFSAVLGMKTTSLGLVQPIFPALARWHLEVVSVRWTMMVSLRLISLAASLPCALPCRLTMPTRLGQGPGRQSALEAVSGSSVWQHANICKWRGPAMTPAHRRNGLCPSQQRTQDGRYTAQHTFIHTPAALSQWATRKAHTNPLATTDLLGVHVKAITLCVAVFLSVCIISVNVRY